MSLESWTGASTVSGTPGVSSEMEASKEVGGGCEDVIVVSMRALESVEFVYFTSDGGESGIRGRRDPRALSGRATARRSYINGILRKPSRDS